MTHHDLPAPSGQQWYGHPRGLFVLFMTEMWERFSYYGMRALLILYLTKHFLFGDGEAALILGSYAALVYAMPVLGGIIGDRYLGYRKSIAFGALLLVCGHFGMAFEGHQASSQLVNGEVMITRDPFYTQVFYLSLALIIIGVGFLKSNISTIVGQLYRTEDPRRDAGFTIFYMGINLGALMATLACGYLGENYGWRYGFGLAGIGMLAGLLNFTLGKPHLRGVGEPPDPVWLKRRNTLGIDREKQIYLWGLIAVIVAWQLVQRTGELGVLLGITGAGVLAWTLWFSFRHCEPVERDRMLVMLFLIFVSIFFWALFEQAGSSITLFTDRNVNIGSFFTAAMFQSFNPFFIIVFALPFAYLWVRLSQKGWEPATPTKFGLGIVQIGLGFAVLIFGASLAGPDGKVNVVWLILMYLLHTTGELCLSPVGLSMVTKLSVQRIAGMMMGVWFLSSSMASYAGALIARLAAIENVQTEALDPALTLPIYTDVFFSLAVVALIMGVLVLLVSRFLQKRMHGIH